MNEKQSDLRLTSALMIKGLGKYRIGRAQDQGYWLKKYSSLHGRLREQLQDCLNGKIIPHLMTRERTILIMKDKSKGNTASNDRPISCLPLVYELT